MLAGRIFGWSLLILAIFTASAEAMAALGTGEYVSIATSDVLTIVTGLSPDNPEKFTTKLLLWPAWFNTGIAGATLLFLCRKKKYKTNFSSK